MTPTLEQGTILPGITRATIIELTKSVLGYTVIEKRLNIRDLKHASEAFCCGTGASITPVGCISYLPSRTSNKPDFDVTFGDGSKPGPVTTKLYDMLIGIQNGDDSMKALEDKYKDWIHVVEP